MRGLPRLVSSLLWGASGAAAVLVFMFFFDESEYLTVATAGVSCGVLRLLFPNDVVAALSRRTWQWLLAYLLVLYGSLMALLFAYLTGKAGFLYTPATLFIWDALAFPASVCAHAIDRAVGGNYGNFVIFAVPPVNTALLALIVGTTLRRRAGRAAVQ